MSEWIDSPFQRSGKESREGVVLSHGDAAVRYFKLSQKLTRDYKFTWDQALSYKRNPGVYLLYECARLTGILRKLHPELGYEARYIEK